MSETTNTFEFDEEKNVFNDEDGNDIKYTIPHTIKLSDTVDIGKETTMSEIVLVKKPNTGMTMHFPVMDMTGLQVGHFVPVIASMSGLPQQIVKKIPYFDLLNIIPVVMYFLVNSGLASEQK